MQQQFNQVVWTKTKWKYHDRETGKLYPVYALCWIIISLKILCVNYTLKIFQDILHVHNDDL